jgi:EAL domain-containing protein (putative c-di-GMP-specific phosphodiesterase class I)
VDAVKRAVATDPASLGLDLEITESALMQDIEVAAAKLQKVRELGFTLALDDFGTGYSSLRYLARLPVQSVKIDRSFVQSVAEDAAIATLVHTIVGLAHSLRMKVVAEGVASEEQAKFLEQAGCDEMQGHLLSKPLPLEELVVFARRAQQRHTDGPLRANINVAGLAHEPPMRRASGDA